MHKNLRPSYESLVWLLAYMVGVVVVGGFLHVVTGWWLGTCYGIVAMAFTAWALAKVTLFELWVRSARKTRSVTAKVAVVRR